MSAPGALIRIEEPWCEEPLAEAVGEVAARYGFSHGAALSLPSTDDVGLATRLIHGNWTPGFARGYEAHGLHKFKIVVGTLRTDPMPFVWDIETLYGSDEPDPSPAARFLLQEGYLADLNCEEVCRRAGCASSSTWSTPVLLISYISYLLSVFV